MKYIIDEEELWKLCCRAKTYEPYLLPKNFVKDFLADKQPVVEIADKRGRVTQEINWILDRGNAPKYEIYIKEIK